MVHLLHRSYSVDAPGCVYSCVKSSTVLVYSVLCPRCCCILKTNATLTPSTHCQTASPLHWVRYRQTTSPVARHRRRHRQLLTVKWWRSSIELFYSVWCCSNHTYIHPRPAVQPSIDTYRFNILRPFGSKHFSVQHFGRLRHQSDQQQQSG